MPEDTPRFTVSPEDFERIKEHLENPPPPSPAVMYARMRLQEYANRKKLQEYSDQNRMRVAGAETRLALAILAGIVVGILLSLLLSRVPL